MKKTRLKNSILIPTFFLSALGCALLPAVADNLPGGSVLEKDIRLKRDADGRVILVPAAEKTADPADQEPVQDAIPAPDESLDDEKPAAKAPPLPPDRELVDLPDRTVPPAPPPSGKDSVKAKPPAEETAVTAKKKTDGKAAPLLPVTGMIHTPTLPAPEREGDVVAVRLKQYQSPAPAGGVATFGQVFAAGHMPRGSGLSARIGPESIPAQMTVKARHPDGSARHAIISLRHPSMDLGEQIDVMLGRMMDPQAGAAISPEDILNAGLDLKVNLDIDGEGSIVIDVATAFREALKSGTLTTWISGPLASDYRLSIPVTEYLDARFNIRADKDGHLETDVIFAMDRAFTTDNRPLDYAVSIRLDGRDSFMLDRFRHHHKTTWHKVIRTQGKAKAHIIHDLPYLISTGAVAPYDFSMGIRAKVIEKAYRNIEKADTGPMGTGTVATHMPATGGRPDLGILPEWTARYLGSQDPRALAEMLANADAAGGIPWHYRDEKTGAPATIDDHPVLWLDKRAGTRVLPAPFSMKGTEWKTDTAHLPSLNYIPYLISGSQYHLEELETQAAYVMAWGDPAYRRKGKGRIYGQVRGQAWSTRDVADAAFILPDDARLKSYFQQKLDYNLKLHVAGITRESPDVISGLIVGAAMYHPWQDDFYSWVIGSIAGRGNDLAHQIASWKAGYTAGRYLAEDFGFDPEGATSYYIETHVDGYDSIFTDWRKLSKFNKDRGNLKDKLGGYAVTSRAALATLANLGIREALEAYGYVAAHTPKDVDYYQKKQGFAIGLHLDGRTIRLRHADQQLGRRGDDVMTGTDAPELMHGRAGNDRMIGGPGQDALFGGDGNDTVIGGRGKDHLFGNKGNDQIQGGPGGDRIKGGKGRDHLEGGPGADIFYYDRLTEGGDVILDFEPGADILDMHRMVQIAGRGSDIILEQMPKGTMVILNTGRGERIPVALLASIAPNSLTIGVDILP